MTTTAGTTTGRVRADLAWLAAGVVVLLVTAVLAADQAVPDAERAVFRMVNGPSVLPFAVVWPVMQLGNVGVVAVAALGAAVTRRFRLAAGLVVGGLGAYGLAKLVKVVVERPRPAGLLDDVQVRGPEVAGYGFVSGHATVAVVVAALLLPYVGARLRWVLIVLAVLVGWARVYVGAHLPLDVVGGAAVAVAVAALVHIVLGRPRCRDRP